MRPCCCFLCVSFLRAPERVDAAGKYSYPSDVWSLGMSLFYLATGALPYDTSKGYWGIVKAIRDDPVPSLPSLHPSTGHPFSPHLRSFIESCMHKDPKARSTASELLAHPFVAGADAAWSAALKAAAPDGILHPLMKVTPADLSDLDALLAALYSSVYAKHTPSGQPAAGADYRKSLMDQARLQRLAESVNNPSLGVAVITKRFEKLYADRREQGR